MDKLARGYMIIKNAVMSDKTLVEEVNRRLRAQGQNIIQVHHAQVHYDNPPEMDLNADSDILRKLGYADQKDLQNHLQDQFDLLKKRPAVTELNVDTELLEKLSKNRSKFLSELPKQPVDPEDSQSITDDQVQQFEVPQDEDSSPDYDPNEEFELSPRANQRTGLTSDLDKMGLQSEPKTQPKKAKKRKGSKKKTSKRR